MDQFAHAHAASTRDTRPTHATADGVDTLRDEAVARTAQADDLYDQLSVRQPDHPTGCGHGPTCTDCGPTALKDEAPAKTAKKDGACTHGDGCTACGPTLADAETVSAKKDAPCTHGDGCTACGPTQADATPVIAAKDGPCEHGDGCTACGPTQADAEKAPATRAAVSTPDYVPPVSDRPIVIAFDIPVSFSFALFDAEPAAAPEGGGMEGGGEGGGGMEGGGEAAMEGGAGGGGGGGAPAGGEAPAPAGPKTRVIPDIIIDGKSGSADASLSAAIGYTSTITRGGVNVGSNFGLCEGYYPSFRNIRVTDNGSSASVTATLRMEVNWDTKRGTGPNSEVNISSATARVINQGNYTQVADDLTPNMGDLGGRPPRSGFWSQSLTERHERFHATDNVNKVRSQIPAATRWLGTQRLPTYPVVGVLDSDVEAKLNTALQNQIINPWVTYMTGNPAEVRAYGDGAGAYRTLAEAIRNKGDNNEYGASPTAGAGASAEGTTGGGGGGS